MKTASKARNRGGDGRNKGRDERMDGRRRERHEVRKRSQKGKMNERRQQMRERFVEEVNQREAKREGCKLRSEAQKERVRVRKDGVMCDNKGRMD